MVAAAAVDSSPTPAPQTSMTLSISRDVAQRMLTASKALNASLASLKKKETENDTSTEKGTTERKEEDASTLQDEVKDKTTESTEDEAVPKRVVSASDSGSVSSSEESPVPASTTTSVEIKVHVPKLLLNAASECGDELIDAFLARVRESETSEHEIETCLLLFLDVDKSTKLSTAFNVLGEAIDADRPANEAPKDAAIKTEPVEENTEDSNPESGSTKLLPMHDKPPLPLNHNGAVMLFKSFLTTISICIHYEPPPSSKRDTSPTQDTVEKPRKALKETDQSSPTSSSKSMDEDDEAESKEDDTLRNQSPSFDATALDDNSDAPTKVAGSLSEQTVKEIQEVATFAADRLLEHVRKENDGASMIPFEAFGDWYNSGGFSIVPWLELLDVAKWNYAGKTAAEERSETQQKAVLSTIKEEPQHTPKQPPTSTAKPLEKRPSPPNFFKNSAAESSQPSLLPTSRILVSFDFTGAMSSGGGSKRPPFSISITEENLLMLRTLVYRTGLVTRSPEEVCQVLLRHSTERVLESGGSVMVLHRDEFGRCIRDLVPPEASRRFSSTEMETFSSYFTNFFSCFEGGVLGTDQVNVKELAVGFSFLCTGNKSTKLAAGFELLNASPSGKLNKEQLNQYLRSYLTMLAGISLLSSSPAGMAEVAKIFKGPRREEMFGALDNGAKWTLGHFLKDFAKGNSDVLVSFEDFARWYTDGGFNIAPWLELLDLSKLLTLLGDSGPNRHPRSGRSAGRHHHLPHSISPKQRRSQDTPSVPPIEVLFTFPLANHRSLVVLREDATYVRAVVEKMGLVNMTPEYVWTSLYDGVKFHPPRPSQKWSRKQRKNGICKTMDVDQVTFVSGMEGVIMTKPDGRKRSSGSKVSSTTKDTLVNFFQSFDLEQVDQVSLNQLMGGLTLLCGGKKSTKLAFAFGLFDSRNDGKNEKSSSGGNQPHSLNGEELFLFLRSFLIVMFSCCRQSLDLSAEAVGRYIADTSHMVTEDVMRYQWRTNKRDRVDFDEFGEWYNEGGFETAPWLELLDLHKWVLVDNVETVETRGAPSSTRAPSMPQHAREGFQPSPQDFDCPPPPPDDAVDPSFFGDDEHAMLPLGSMDEMDYMLMQQPSQDKENDGVGSNRTPLPTTPHLRERNNRGRTQNSLKFHLITNDDHGGYMLSISQRRVRHIRHILMESALCSVDSEMACKKILSKASRVRSNRKGSKARRNEEDMLLSKDDFDSAMRSIIAGGRTKPSMSPETQRTLSDLLGCVFNAFDRSQNGLPSAMEVACGFTVLCNGKKSDKLEYAFELLDMDKDGKLSRRDMTNYLRSFLTALLSIVSAPCLDVDEMEDMITLRDGSRCDRGSTLTARIVDSGSSWAASQAFKSGFKEKSDRDTITFDDFAEWYTNQGYSSIPWLELLDLRKWVLVDNS